MLPKTFNLFFFPWNICQWFYFSACAFRTAYQTTSNSKSKTCTVGKWAGKDSTRSYKVGSRALRGTEEKRCRAEPEKSAATQNRTIVGTAEGSISIAVAKKPVKQVNPEEGIVLMHFMVQHCPGSFCMDTSQSGTSWEDLVYFMHNSRRVSLALDELRSTQQWQLFSVSNWFMLKTFFFSHYLV